MEKKIVVHLKNIIVSTMIVINEVKRIILSLYVVTLWLKDKLNEFI